MKLCFPASLVHHLLCLYVILVAVFVADLVGSEASSLGKVKTSSDSLNHTSTSNGLHAGSNVTVEKDKKPVSNQKVNGTQKKKNETETVVRAEDLIEKPVFDVSKVFATKSTPAKKQKKKPAPLKKDKVVVMSDNSVNKTATKTNKKPVTVEFDLSDTKSSNNNSNSSTKSSGNGKKGT